MMPMARAMVAAVLLVAVGVDLLSYHSYLWRIVKAPWRVIVRWRAAKGIQREIDAMPVEARRLKLVVGGSSRGVR